jgi:serine/threonine protein kinase
MNTPNFLNNNRYQIIDDLGEGGFGKTFLAIDTHSPAQRKCVVKLLKPINNDPAVYKIVQDRFYREAVVLEQLGEENHQIPRLFAYFNEGGEFYLVQEFIEGKTLMKKVQTEGKIPEYMVKEILINLLPVLEFIHSKGIVHRDIKPENIIIREKDGKPVLIDFGAVRETMATMVTTGGNVTSSIVIGTPGFMPAEQAAGRPVFSSDLYSLGLTAIYLLTGKFPQELGTDNQTGKVLWIHHTNISQTLATILDKSIEYAPRDRYTNPREMLISLQNPPQQTETFASPQGGNIPPTIAVSPPPYQQTPPYQNQGGNIPPTIAVSPPPYQQTPPYQTPPYQTPPYQQQVTPPVVNNSLPDWVKAVITGGIIGSFVLGGFWIYAKQNNQVTTSKPEVKTENNSISDNKNQPVKTAETPQTNNTQTLTEDDGKNLIVRWLQAKRTIFAPPYDYQIGAELMTGKAYQDNIQGPNSKGEPESSREWLKNRGGYYTYGVQRVDSVNSFAAEGEYATIEVVVTEERALYNNEGKRDIDNSAFSRSLVRYSLQNDNGKWKIADYKTVTRY